MIEKIEPADYARLMNVAKLRSHALRRTEEFELWLQIGRAARRLLHAVRRVTQARSGSARQVHQMGA